MKNLYLFFFLFISVLHLNAQVFWMGDLKYRVLSVDGRTVEVSSCKILSEGDCVVPSSVQYCGREYSVVAIGANAFSYCVGITNIELPFTVEKIGHWAFLCCSNLVTANLGDSVKSIGYSAFRNCKKLRTVVAPPTLAVVEDWAFANCISLDDLVFKGDLSYLGNSSFKGCCGLKSLVIDVENNDLEISSGAFLQSSSIRLLNINSLIPPKISFSAFDKEICERARLVVPVGCATLYKEAKGWENFVNVQEGELLQ